MEPILPTAPTTLPLLRAPLTAAVLVLIATLPLAGCIPPQRSNVPLPAAVVAGTVDAGADSAGNDSVVDSAAGSDARDADGDVGSDADVVEIAKGCTVDVDCDVLAFDVCHVASCDAGTGKCVVSNAKNGLPCTSASACVASSTCKAGACSGTQKVCDDNNACTLDGCDLATGCTATDVSKLCDDGNPCTVEDICSGGKCGGLLRDCKEAVTQCETAACNAKTGSCNKLPRPKGTPCDDGNPCTKAAACDGNQCKGANACDDGDPCTNDACAPGGKGCVHFKLQGQSGGCQDGDPCIIATCDNGKCVKTPKSCDDKTDCTSDTCLPDGTCKFTKLLTGPCDDADPCTTGEACNKGQCKSTETVSCDDGNACTDDSCVAFEGCKHAASTKICNDGSACTVDDTCKDGKCGGKAKNCNDENACTVDGCAALTGTCMHTSAPEGASCSGGSCKSGACAVGS